MAGQVLTRRRFLKHTAAGAAALGMGMIAGGPAAGRIPGAADRVNIGIIGCGAMGRNHLRELVHRQKQPRQPVRVAGVCDIFEPRKLRAREISGAPVYHDYRKLLERRDLDAVVIATPDHWHARMTLDALDAGKDVYVERPMTHTWEEAREVARAAREKGRIVQVGVQSTSEDIWRKAGELVRQGRLGRVLWSQTGICRNSPEGERSYPPDGEASPASLDWKAFLGPAPRREFDPSRFFRWRNYWDYSGGIATDLFYEQLAHLLVALGPEFPTRVTASGGVYVQREREVPDTFFMTVDYPSEHTVVLVSSLASKQCVPEIIRGQKATLYFEGPRLIIRPETAFRQDEDAETILAEPRPGHMDNFIECVRTRKAPNCDAELGYRTMTAIALGILAYRQNRVMVFDPSRQRLRT